MVGDCTTRRVLRPGGTEVPPYIRLRGKLRQPEVKHLDRSGGCHLDIGRLEIAVDDAAFVRCFQRLRDLPCDR